MPDDTLTWTVQIRLNQSRCCLGYGLRWARESMCYMGPISPCEEAVISGKDMPGHAGRHYAVSCAKWLNRSICHLGCGLRCAEGSTSSIVFAGWRQCALMGGHTGATWRIRFNRPSAAAMRPYVKLLWPLVIIGVNIEKDYGNFDRNIEYLPVFDVRSWLRHIEIITTTKVAPFLESITSPALHLKFYEQLICCVVASATHCHLYIYWCFTTV